MPIDISPGATVLAVDESGATLSRLSAALRDDGYSVIAVTSEHDVAQALSAQSVDCIVLPLESATTTVRQRAAAASVPLLITVPAGDDALVMRALDDGAEDCAPVSGDLSLLKSRLRTLLRRKRAAGDRNATLASALARKDAELVSLNYAVSHDLRAPLRAVDGFSRILIEECAGTLDPKHINYLERIAAAAGELGVLIDDLLQLSRVGRAELRKGRVDLSDLARRAAADLQERSDRQVEVDVDAELIVYADRTLMRLALEHLIGNSWKFTAHTQPARIELRSETIGGEMAIVVRDNGVGFDQARVGKLFQPFQRLHTTAEFDGAGIGLAVVHKIVDRHGGRVWAEGRVGQGASFFFTVPPAPDGDSR